ncbi:hypothetical protein MOMA_05170 [Moraxella macacae 0408225]|uniref:Cell division protein ZapA n=1 Tax=Moraxella macacae 0408225 TaxID=1230338 RepID=L2FAH8_9GAMM|nr:cell division protein ZapA [Moraxella macacae]ELA09766.1 hypothetical protein MOMA_05170 [Moraxella macacae 0408225]
MSNQHQKVDIFINGRSYGINCPKGEESALQHASSYMNTFIQEIRRTSPQLPQEELLLLCALTLFEKTQNLQNELKIATDANHLLDEMLKNIKKSIY